MPKASPPMECIELQMSINGQDCHFRHARPSRGSSPFLTPVVFDGTDETKKINEACKINALSSEDDTYHVQTTYSQPPVYVLLQLN